MFGLKLISFALFILVSVIAIKAKMKTKLIKQMRLKAFKIFLQTSYVIMQYRETMSPLLMRTFKIIKAIWRIIATADVLIHSINVRINIYINRRIKTK